MPDVENYEILILGSGEAGKWTAWTMADGGHRTAMVERKWLGGSCPNIACLPSKNVIYSARVASLARRGPNSDWKWINSTNRHGRRPAAQTQDGRSGTSVHAKRTADAGVELIMGEGRFVAPRTVEVALNDGGTRRIVGERLFLTWVLTRRCPMFPGSPRRIR